MKFGGLKFVSPQYDRQGPSFTFAPVVIQPQSVGYVTLRSSNPLDVAMMQPNYLSLEQTDEYHLRLNREATAEIR
jgi:choline dehydrogenase